MLDDIPAIIVDYAYVIHIKPKYKYHLISRVYRRTSTEISGLILMLLKDGAQKKSSIQKRLNVDNRTLNRYLDILAKQGLITISDKHIEITEKGVYFTEIYKELIRLLDKNRISSRKR
ncbi:MULTISPECIES: winged helix-turn-helix domain-containing protein [Candidatus Nitrosocaldus]|uniref:ArnR1-like winged helix-turn-helix domain-containing protein n=1 Tax=Candidatus Nitrosocaldus cavascurensis TaxID=2058097 RepID=A0A2K5ASZ5_9ARCH|nr:MULTISPECIES: winged helix-turn-helix domain-containing protein [Candidatus Nitrosocaldus]SPC34739.1 protein of unknown function [Candidatus Nitrosocaldus cavascurensis]